MPRVRRGALRAHDNYIDRDGIGAEFGGSGGGRMCPANAKAPGYRPGAFASWMALVLDAVRGTETILTDRRLAVNC